MIVKNIINGGICGKYIKKGEIFKPHWGGLIKVNYYVCNVTNKEKYISCDNSKIINDIV